MKNRNTAAKLMLIFGLAVALILAVAIAVNIPRLNEARDLLAFEQSVTPSPDPTAGAIYAVTPDPSAPSPSPTPLILKNGSAGLEVRKLQTRLLELGYYSGDVDGQFGNMSKAAVIWFQRQHNLDADGVAGPATLEILYSDKAQTAVATPTPVPPATPSPDDCLILVNKTRPLPDGYAAKDLVYLKDVCPSNIVTVKGSEIQGTRLAVNALISMLTDAVDSGVKDWQVSAGYRSVAYQQTLFDRQVEEYISKNNLSRRDAISATRQTVADPGTSEHHTGLAFDITTPGTSFKGTPQAKWLAEHCWDYGFIIRYTEEKQDITGYLAEPWHIRYVGETAASIIQQNNWCLEEYIAALEGQ